MDFAGNTNGDAAATGLASVLLTFYGFFSTAPWLGDSDHQRLGFITYNIAKEFRSG